MHWHKHTLSQLLLPGITVWTPGMGPPGGNTGQWNHLYHLGRADNAPKHGTEQNEHWLVALHVSQMACWADESCDGVQTFCCQSEGLVTQD